MDSSVIVAVISLIGTLGGSLCGILVSAKLTAYRLEQLEKKVDKHNHVVEKVYGLQADRDLFAEKLKVANHRIDDLEHRGN